MIEWQLHEMGQNNSLCKNRVQKNFDRNNYSTAKHSGFLAAQWQTRCSCLIGSWRQRKRLPMDSSLRFISSKKSFLWTSIQQNSLKLTLSWRCYLRTCCIQSLPHVLPNTPPCPALPYNTARWTEIKHNTRLFAFMIFFVTLKLATWTFLSGSGAGRSWEGGAETAEPDGEQSADGEVASFFLNVPNSSFSLDGSLYFEYFRFLLFYKVALWRSLPTSSKLSVKKEKVKYFCGYIFPMFLLR